MSMLHIELENEAAEEAEQLARWHWVMGQLQAKVVSFAERTGLSLTPDRSNNPGTLQEFVSHLLWMGSPEGKQVADHATKAMRWACWMQGAMCVLKITNLDESKHLNMKKSWELYGKLASQTTVAKCLCSNPVGVGDHSLGCPLSGKTEKST